MLYACRSLCVSAHRCRRLVRVVVQGEGKRCCKRQDRGESFDTVTTASPAGRSQGPATALLLSLAVVEPVGAPEGAGLDSSSRGNGRPGAAHRPGRITPPEAPRSGEGRSAAGLSAALARQPNPRRFPARAAGGPVDAARPPCHRVDTVAVAPDARARGDAALSVRTGAADASFSRGHRRPLRTRLQLRASCARAGTADGGCRPGCPDALHRRARA